MWGRRFGYGWMWAWPGWGRGNPYPFCWRFPWLEARLAEINRRLEQLKSGLK